METLQMKYMLTMPRVFILIGIDDLTFVWIICFYDFLILIQGQIQTYGKGGQDELRYYRLPSLEERPKKVTAWSKNSFQE